VLDVTRLLFRDGIQLNGLPAPPAEFTDAYLPFHPAGRTFHRTQTRPRRLSTPHRHLAYGRFVSVPEPELSPRAFASAAVQRGGRSFLRCQAPGAVRQLTSPTDKWKSWGIRILESRLKRIVFRLVFLGKYDIESRMLWGFSGDC